MFRKKCLCEIHKVRYDSVPGVSPARSELKAVAGFLFSGISRISVLDNIETRAVGVIFGIGAVADNKYLNILVQTAACPETVALIAVYLIECFADRNAASFKIFEIVDERYRSGKPLIVTTNLNPDDAWKSNIGMRRIFDSLKERCRNVVMDGESRRKAC